jgi:hypothetical protein
MLEIYAFKRTKFQFEAKIKYQCCCSEETTQQNKLKQTQVKFHFTYESALHPREESMQ